MKLAISNIAWPAEKDRAIYKQMQSMEFRGLEIAPTRLFPENPYDKIKDAKVFSKFLQEEYGLSVCSMQSIWYGRTENIFGTEQERQILIDYTKRAIDFAVAVGCSNLVFGCPRNRNFFDDADKDKGVAFFQIIGDYAATCGTVIGMEANPPIYGTNYVNNTTSAIQLVRDVGSRGFRLNLDVGTMIYNAEPVRDLINSTALINHVHISEPELKVIQARSLHYELNCLLKKIDYPGYVSIEMGRVKDVSTIIDVMKYLKIQFD